MVEVLRWLWDETPPAAVREKARLVILDTLGCAIAARGNAPVERMAELLDGSPLSQSAFLAVAACTDEACEGLARAHGRPGVPVVAACLAFGSQHDLPAIVDAVVAGYEIGGRAGEMLRIRSGMHVDGAWPALGVAAAVSRLLGGSVAEANAAIALAACQVPFSLYLPIEQAADGRNTYLGHAAWLGAYSALAARAGYRAPDGAIDRYAELALLRHPAEAPGPGEYVILEGYLKAFAAVRHVHYGAEAALQLRERVDRVEKIELTVYEEAIRYCGNRAPRAPIEAQFSLSFGVAAALRFGRLDPSVYRSPEFEDAELRRLEALVEVRDGRFERREAVLRINDALECHVGELPPFTRQDCLHKFLVNAAGLGEEKARAVGEGILESEGKLAEVLP